MRLLGLFLPSRFMSDYWTTIGHTIYVPTRFDNSPAWISGEWAEQEVVIDHEYVHVEQVERWGLPIQILMVLCFPLPIFFAWGRWRIEREAYLVNIKAGWDIDYIVDMLWGDYLMPWPTKWMKAWFKENSTT